MEEKHVPRAGANEQIRGFLGKKQSSHPEDVCVSRDTDVDDGWVGYHFYHH